MTTSQKNNYATVAGSGLIAGMVGVTIPFPFNLVRCLQQTGAQDPQASVSRTIRKIASSKGLRGLYRGFSTSFLLYSPATAVFYPSYFYFTRWFTELTGNETASTFTAGLVANSFAGLMWTPMDNIVQRVWLQNQNPMKVVKKIHRQSGLSGFWRAYGTTLCVWAPLSGIFFVAYEAAMSEFRSHININENDESLLAIPASAFAASIAVTATNPIDVIRTRYQVDSGKLLLDVARKGLKTDGHNLFRIGLRARLLAIVPDLTLNMFIFEMAYKFLNDMQGTTPHLP